MKSNIVEVATTTSASGLIRLIQNLSFVIMPLKIGSIGGATSPWGRISVESAFRKSAHMLAVLNTVVLSLMDRHREALVARQIRRFSSHPDEALAWVIDF